MCRWAVAAALAAASACGEATGPSGGVKIVAATGTLAQLDTLQLSVAGDGRVTWTTSEPAVATVSPAGLVTAAYFGHATIYASRGG